MSKRDQDGNIVATNSYLLNRGPGKRKIKPTAFAAVDVNIHDDESDEDFVHQDAESADDEEVEDENEDESEGGSDEEDEEAGSNDEESSAQMLASKSSSTTPADGKPDPLICSVCLNMRNVSGDRVIVCDSCAVAVHESCYAVQEGDDSSSVISNFSTEPWFCEPCLFELPKPPHCELCPSRYGAFKRSDVGGKWLHLTCAMYTPGATFADPDTLTGASWQEIDVRRFGRKQCDGCSNVLESRTGVTTGCEAGLCKKNYHISCAQRLGLLVDSQAENMDDTAPSGRVVDPHFLLCAQHSCSDTVAKKKKNYAIFMRQEKKRMIVLNRRLLDERDSYKLSVQRREYDDRVMKCLGGTITLPPVITKRARSIQTSAEAMDSFTEKAELYKVLPKQFKDDFLRVPPAQMPYLMPAFSESFVRYYHHRNDVVFGDEQRRHSNAESELKKVLQAEKDLKLMLEKILSNSPETKTTVKQKQTFEKRFTNICELLGLTFEQEEPREVYQEDTKPAKNSQDKAPINGIHA